MSSCGTPDQALQVSHVIPSIAKQASGLSQTVPALCEALVRSGANVELHLLTPHPPQQPAGVKVIVYPRWPIPYRLGMSASLWRSLRATAEQAHIIHSHSLWTMPNIASGLVVSPTTTARLIVSPHGTLGAWALEHHRWRKKLVWWCGQQFALARAACFHATAESEAEDIRRFGFRQPIAIIPNGIDIPDKRRNEMDERGPRRILFMGRLHPIKGLDRLIHAWANIAHTHEDWELIIAGPEDYAGYQGELEGLVKRLGALRVSFPGGIYGAQKSELLRCCDLFVLPSHTENFSMVVAESLAHGIPVIASKGTPWIDIDRNGCGWWVENSVEELQACLNKAMHLQQDALKSMGVRGRDWMERDFSWNTISRQFNDVYLWLCENAARPDCVILD